MLARLTRRRVQLIAARGLASDVKDLKLETSQLDAELLATTTGVMDVQNQKEVLFFYDNLFPRWLARLSYRKYLGVFLFLDKFQADDKIQKHLFQLAESTKHPLPKGTRVNAFVPLKRDGGAFIKFCVAENSSTKELAAAVEANIQRNKQEHSKTLMGYVKLLFRPFPRAYIVKGTPWIEDLYRFPSPKLSVRFEGKSLTEEELYLLFRRYGMILDIKPSSDGATVVFKTTNACIRAKNCITGISLNKGDTTLHLQYIPVERVNNITNFISNHQRIAIPVLLALLAAFAVVVFEPIRQTFIEIKIKHKYSWEAHKDNWIVKLVQIPYRTVMNWISDGKHFVDDSLGSLVDHKADKKNMVVSQLESNFFWGEGSLKADQVRLWILENVNTFIIVNGPKGSGKREFVVDHALQLDKALSKNVLEIDCEAMLKTRSDNAFLKALAGQLGYFPLFTWTNSVSQFIDLGLQGLTGQKSGLSESKETQVKNMLQLALVAIRKVALSDFGLAQCEYRQQQEQNNEEKVLELHEDDYLQLNPTVKPVIVINNFARKAGTSNDFVFELLGDWASQLVQSNTAHVIFITLDLSSVQHLTNALPSQVFKSISLADAGMLSSLQYVNAQLADNARPPSLEQYLRPIGGRMLDLQAFARRVKSGELPEDALSEMVNQAAEQVTTFFLNTAEKADATWTPSQIWALVRVLAHRDSFEFTDLVMSPLFGANYETVALLSTLEKNDLISVKRDMGIVSSVSTGRPLYKEAFKTLVGDPRAFELYETNYFKQLIAVENAKIRKWEEEITTVGSISEPKLVRERLDHISRKLAQSTAKVEEYEDKVKQIVGKEVKRGFFSLGK